MKSFIVLLALSLVVLPAMSMADEPPPVPEGGLTFYFQASCEDNETGQKGYCYFGHTIDGRTFMSFFQGETLMFIREVLGRTEYKQMWTNPQYVSV